MQNESGYIQFANSDQNPSNLLSIYNADSIRSCISSVLPRPDNSETQKIVLESCQAIAYFTNQSTASVSFDIYDCVPRRDMPQQGQAASNDPITMWQQGMLDQGIALDTNPLAVVGVTPFQSPMFCESWKIMKVSKVILPQGGNHEHRVHIGPNSNFNRATMRNNDYYLKGFSAFTFVVVRGFPVDGVALNTGVPNTVTTSGGKLDFVTTYKYTMTSISTAESNIAIVDRLLTVAQASMINIGSGQVANPQNA